MTFSTEDKVWMVIAAALAVGLLLVLSGCNGVAQPVDVHVLPPDDSEVAAAMNQNLDELDWKPDDQEDNYQKFLLLKADHKVLVKQVVWLKEQYALLKADYDNLIANRADEFPYAAVISTVAIGLGVWVLLSLVKVPFLGISLAPFGSTFFLVALTAAFYLAIKPHLIGLAFFASGLLVVFIIYKLAEKYLATKGVLVDLVTTIDAQKVGDPAFETAIKEKVGANVSPTTSAIVDSIRETASA